MRAYSAKVMAPSISSAARARASSATPSTSGKALPKRAPVSPEAVRAFVREREEAFLNSSGSEARASSSLRRLVRAQTRALERSLDRETGDRRDHAEHHAERADDVGRSSSSGVRTSAHRPDDALRAHPFPDETLDVLFRRRLLLLQARKGYRCNVDSLLLAAHAHEALRRRVGFGKIGEAPCAPDGGSRRGPRVADLGAGCGVVGLAVALGGRADDESGDGDAEGTDETSVRVLSIERQASLASRCARNAALNGLSDRVCVRGLDVADVAEAAIEAPTTRANAREETRAALSPWLRTCDAVVVNPPYYPRDAARAAGTQPRETERRDAHYETTATLLDFARAAEALLSLDGADEEGRKGNTPRPAAHFVYPAERAAAVAAACAAAGLGDVAIKNVFTDEQTRAADGAPVLALIDARRPAGDPERDGDPEKRIETHMVDSSGVLYADDAQRTYSAEVETFMRDLGL